jgi:hypothetical protein
MLRKIKMLLKIVTFFNTVAPTLKRKRGNCLFSTLMHKTMHYIMRLWIQKKNNGSFPAHVMGLFIEFHLQIQLFH